MKHWEKLIGFLDPPLAINWMFVARAKEQAAIMADGARTNLLARQKTKALARAAKRPSTILKANKEVRSWPAKNQNIL